MPDETPEDNPFTHLVEQTEEAMHEAEQAVKHLFSSDPTPAPVITKEIGTMADDATTTTATATPDTLPEDTTSTTDTSSDLSLVECPSCGTTGGLIASDVKAPKGSAYAHCLKCSRRVVLVVS